MTDAPGSGRIGPGRLVLVVGPSGAGKDTLIGAARKALADSPRVVFPRRFVTRPPSAAEDNETISVATFAEVVQAGGFALSWSAHGLSYGIPATIDAALAEGCTVVCNVSRTIILAARNRYADVRVIEVTARPDILARRLADRARAEDGELAPRLARSIEVGPIESDVTIVNEGPLDPVCRTFIAALDPARAMDASVAPAHRTP